MRSLRSKWKLFSYSGLSALMLFLAIVSVWMASAGSGAALAHGTHRAVVPPHLTHRLKPRPHHVGSGAPRTHVGILPVLAHGTGRARAQHGQGALVPAKIAPATATTLFYDDFESGATGWTTVGDNATTPYYPNGHDFWNLAASPQTLSVPGAVNPTLVTYPDAAGALPSANSGTHAFWYGDNPAADTTNPAGASMTYMGNESDWPNETANDGGISNGPNSGSLISPPINLSSATNATLSFATWWEIESVNPAHFDMMYVDVTSDGGATWHTLGTLNPQTNPAGGADAYPYSDNGLDVPATWESAAADLTPYVGSTIQVRFRFDSVDGYDNGFRGWLIDDVGVYEQVGAAPRISAVSPNAGVAGAQVTITGAGFGASQGTSTVTFNGVAAAATSWSDTSLTVTVPAGASSGPLVVTVNGAQAPAVSFTVNAAVTLASPSAFPESTDALSGQGFAPGETVNVFLNGVTGTLLASGAADGAGNLASLSLTTPTIPGGSYLVLAEGQTSHITAGATLNIVPSLSTASATVKPAQSVAVTGLGFGAYESVQIQLDSGTSPILGYLSCDGSGSCSSNVTLPSSNVLQGIHSLIGLGDSTGLIANAPVTFTPAIVVASPSPAHGGPGTEITLTGAAFSANETAQIYWGGTSGISEGSTTTDASGNLSFSFAAPTPVSPGTYSIVVVRSNHSPSPVSTRFTILSPVLNVLPGGIHSGQVVQITVSGFQAYESVNLTWNANGGQAVTTIYADDTGGASGSFTPPSAPHGSYTVTAQGATSGLTATHGLNIGPGISLSVSQSNPGNTLTVYGGGFTAGAQINVYFQTTKNGVQAVTADGTGAFTTTLTVPLHYSPATTYYVHAVSTTTSESAKSLFSYILPSIYTYYSVSYGQQTYVSASGFASNETVNVVWAYQQTGQLKVATLTADANGNIASYITVPSEPNLGSVTVAAVGVTSGLKATVSIYEYAALNPTPSSGPSGTKIALLGGGFAAGETVTLVYEPTGATIATLTASTRGAVKASFTIPSGTSQGYVYFSGAGATSGISVSGSFLITGKLVIAPTTGPAGTSVTVNGSRFTPSSAVDLYWYDPSCAVQCYYYFGNFPTDSTGAFSTTITAPSYVSAGAPYYVQAYDNYTGYDAQAAFTGQ